MEWIEWLFGGDVPEAPLHLHQVAARAVLIYMIGLAIVRLGKSRLVSRATPLDILLGFILGSLLSRGVTGHASLSATTAASATMVAVHWLCTWAAYRWHGFGILIKGQPIPLIQDGEMVEANLRSTHISEHDLAEAARLHGVGSAAEIEAAYKERNGEVSIIRRDS